MTNQRVKVKEDVKNLGAFLKKQTLWLGTLILSSITLTSNVVYYYLDENTRIFSLAASSVIFLLSGLCLLITRKNWFARTKMTPLQSSLIPLTLLVLFLLFAHMYEMTLDGTQQNSKSYHYLTIRGLIFAVLISLSKGPRLKLLNCIIIIGYYAQRSVVGKSWELDSFIWLTTTLWLVLFLSLHLDDTSLRLQQRLRIKELEVQDERQISDIIREGVIIFDKDEKVLWSNSAISKQLKELKNEVSEPTLTFDDFHDSEDTLRRMKRIFLDCRFRENQSSFHNHIRFVINSRSARRLKSRRTVSLADMADLEKDTNQRVNVGSLEEFGGGYSLSHILKDLVDYFESVKDVENHQPKINDMVKLDATVRVGKKVRVYELQLGVTLYGERLAGFIFLTDLSDLEELKVLKESNTFKNRLLSSVSHELRTPLNGAMGFLAAAGLDREVPSRLREEYITPAHRCLKQLLFVISDLIDFNELQFNEMKLEMTTFDLRWSLSELIELVEFQLAAKGIKLVVNIKSSVPTLVRTDKNRLHSVLLNILNNAIKYTNEGTVKLIVDRDPQYDDHISFQIEDTGIGMSEEELHRVLQLTSQTLLNQKISDHSTGFGLGLTISQKMISLLSRQKTIKIYSRERVGTLISFSAQNHIDQEIALGEAGSGDGNESIAIEVMYNSKLAFEERLAPEKLAIPTPKKYKFPTNNSKLGGEIKHFSFTEKEVIAIDNIVVFEKVLVTDICPCQTILVVDDDMYNIFCLKKQLTMLGYTVIEATNGKEAIEKVTSELERKVCGDHCLPVKLILMDSNMPIMNGQEATVILKRKMDTGEMPWMPIVACTAYVFNEGREKCMAAGMDAFLSKPVKISELQSTLDYFLKKLPFMKC